MKPSTLPLSLGLAAIATAGCLPGSTRPTVDRFETGPDWTCSVNLDPSLMTWNHRQRDDLGRLRKEGTVVVRYSTKGCDVELQVLDQCRGPAKYSYEPGWGHKSRSARNQNEIQTEFPLGAAQLSGKLATGREVRADFVTTGTVSLPDQVSRAQLAGKDCDKATHYIARLTLGGFTLKTGNSESLAAGAYFLNAGASGGKSSAVTTEDEQGNPAACEKAKRTGLETPDCVVPLYALLVALDEPVPGIVWVPFPGGTYEMGNDAMADEGPVHKVSVEAFSLSRSEITNAQWNACVKAGACRRPRYNDADCWKPPAAKWADFQVDDHPVVCVNWAEANGFAQWAGRRLPSEAEWEYAARNGGQRIKYPWGDQAATCTRAVMDNGREGCGANSTAAVCSKDPVNYLCDMAGNAWEWLADWYEPYEAKARIAPNEAGARFRVDRGGSWTNVADHLRTTYRRYTNPEFRFANGGFRLLKDGR